MGDAFSEGRDIKFQTNDILFKQDHPSDGAYVIIDGMVDLWRKDMGEEHKVATIHSGDLLGEVSVIEDKNHSVTAIAAQPTTVLFINAKTFKKRFSDPMVRFVVTTLATRLRSSYTSSTVDESPKKAKPKSDHPFLEADSPILKPLLPDGVELLNFPFRVGNKGSGDHKVSLLQGHLQLPLQNIHSFSTPHFEIVKSTGDLLVRDLGNLSGTVVNGKLLKKYTQQATAPLRIGENIIKVPDGDNSLNFKVTIPWNKPK